MELEVEMFRRIRRALLVPALTILLCSACTGSVPPEQPGMCTLMGCIDSLTIRMAGSVPAEFQVQLEFEDRIQTIECGMESRLGDSASPDDSSCMQSVVVFWNAAPEEARIRISGDGIVYEETIHPGYNLNQPNGPDCLPICRSGEATVRIP